MERRNKLVLLILLALALLIFGVWYLLQPILENSESDAKNTPPPLVQEPKNLADSVPKTPEEIAIDEGQKDLRKVQSLAGIVVSRIGSGASGEGFRGYEDVLINATASYRKVLLEEQAAMQALHPATGPSFGVVTRVVAIKIAKADPNASSVSYVVQVQQAEDAGDPNAPTKVYYKDVTVTFEKQPDKSYLLNGLVWKNIEL